MQICTHLSRFALISRVFPGRYAKKYTGYCIIACVPMWWIGLDSNQRRLALQANALPSELPIHGASSGTRTMGSRINSAVLHH